MPIQPEQKVTHTIHNSIHSSGAPGLAPLRQLANKFLYLMNIVSFLPVPFKDHLYGP